jgi:hypothetical protein
MKEAKKRTLYECGNARVKGNEIYCRKGYRLHPHPFAERLELSRLARGDRLAFKPCQDCPDFDCIGAPVPPEERGWLKTKEASTGA